jgi:hypothetical protein
MVRTVRNLVFAALAAALTLPAADMLSGTWKLNSAKSKFDPGPGPKSSMTRVSMEGDWLVSSTESVSADGKPLSYTNRYKLDGKEYPYKTSTFDGTISVKWIDDYHNEGTLKGKKGDRMLGKLAISKDGKTRTIISTGTNAEGKPIHNVVVYEKQ